MIDEVVVVKGIKLDISHDGTTIFEVQPYHDQDDILPLLSRETRNAIEKATGLEIYALKVVGTFLSDPTIPLSQRHGGMDFHRDGLD
jgi:hypothetical protein